MSGETNLDELLTAMSPALLEEEYVFCSLENSRYGGHAELEPLAAFTETEGLTLVVPKRRADEHSLQYESVFRCIILTVHSSLDAVGLTAAVSAALAEQSISANVIAAYYHDNIFVQADRADQALKILRELSR